MQALATDVRELGDGEVDFVTGAGLAAAIIVGAVLIVFEEPIKGFVDGMVKGFTDDK